MNVLTKLLIRNIIAFLLKSEIKLQKDEIRFSECRTGKRLHHRKSY